MRFFQYLIERPVLFTFFSVAMTFILGISMSVMDAQHQVAMLHSKAKAEKTVTFKSNKPGALVYIGQSYDHEARKVIGEYRFESWPEVKGLIEHESGAYSIKMPLASDTTTQTNHMYQQVRVHGHGHFNLNDEADDLSIHVSDTNPKLENLWFDVLNSDLTGKITLPKSLANIQWLADEPLDYCHSSRVGLKDCTLNFIYSMSEKMIAFQVLSYDKTVVEKPKQALFVQVFKNCDVIRLVYAEDMTSGPASAYFYLTVNCKNPAEFYCIEAKSDYLGLKDSYFQASPYFASAARVAAYFVRQMQLHHEVVKSGDFEMTEAMAIRFVRSLPFGFFEYK